MGRGKSRLQGSGVILIAWVGQALAAGNALSLQEARLRVALQKNLRDRLNRKRGTRLTVKDTPQGVLPRAAPLFEPTTLDQVFDCLKYDGPAKTLEEMDAAVDDMIRERHARGPS